MEYKANGKAGCDGSQTSDSLLYQNIGNQSGKTIKFSFTVSDYVSGTVKTAVFGASGTAVYSITSNGDYTFYINVLSGHNGNTGFKAEVGFEGKIDNVSVKQVDPNDRWTLQSGWVFGTNKCTFNDSSTANLYQSITLTSGKNYRIKFTISNSTGSGARMAVSNFAQSVFYIGSGYAYYTDGDYIFNYTASSTTSDLAFKGHTDGSSFDINNISVVEVQGDRPRLSYDITNGVVEDKPHLLLEPSATNLVTFSEDFTQWDNTQTTDTSNATTSPSGQITADKITKLGNNANDRVRLTSIAVSNSTSYAISFFVKNDSNVTGAITTFAFRVTSGTLFRQGIEWTGNVPALTDTNSAGTRTNKILQNYGNGWYRVGFAFTTDGTDGIFEIDVDRVNGTNTTSIFVWGAMLEQQAFATSYLKTAGTTITRAAETCNNSKPSVNSTEGVLYAEIAALSNDLTNRRITLSDGSNNNRVVIGYNTVSQQIFYFIIVGGSNIASGTSVRSDITNFDKVAVKFKNNDFAFYIDGSLISTDTSGTIFSANTLNSLQFEQGAGNALFFYGKVKGLAVYNEALSESQLFQLTGVTASSIYNNFVTRTASFTVEALNEVKKVIDNL